MRLSPRKRIIVTGGSGFIGTNLVEFYLQQGWDVLNVDFRPPRNPQHKSVWENVDILNYAELNNIVREFQPSFLLHFAARTDLNEKNNLNGYAANMEGVQNIVEVVKSSSSINRVVFTSSQLVCKIGYNPKNYEDYCPNTLYGESKVHTEQIVRSSGDIGASWVIIRPTSLWGPWFDIPYKNFFEAIRKGIYIHPAGIDTYKQWGFVLNAVYQVNKLIEIPQEMIHKKTFYLADYQPILLKDFGNLVQQEFKANRIPSIPYELLKTIGYIGDAIQYLGWKNPPLSSFRLHNIITNEIQNLTPLEDIVGQLPYNVNEGIHITVEWLNNHNDMLNHSIKH